MITVGSKIKAIKEVEGVLDVGTVCEVVKMTNKMIHFSFGYHLGIMTLEEYEEYFEEVKLEPEKPIRKWTEWRVNSFDPLDGCVSFEYRTNGKRVQVRTKEGLNPFNPFEEKQWIKAEACCHCTDNFSFESGLELAAWRMVEKVAAHVVKDILKDLD